MAIVSTNPVKRYMPGDRKRKFFEEQRRRYLAPDKTVASKEAADLVFLFKKKATSRLKRFYEESQRMDIKFAALLQKVEDLGYHITQLRANAVDVEYYNNPRKKNKFVRFSVSAQRGNHTFEGELTVTPASMNIQLMCPNLRAVRSKGGFTLHHLKVSYYRSIVVNDNYLAALLK